MKNFIYLCCIAQLLTVISARLRLTTPMPAGYALRSNNDAASQTSNIAEMIEFVNSVYNNDGRSIARNGIYDPTLRRRQLELLEVKDTHFPSKVTVPNDDDTENQLENLEAVRYQVIQNPEVLEEYRNKQKKKKKGKNLKPVSITETSVEAKSFSTVEVKLRYYHSKSNSTVSHKSTNNKKLNKYLHTPHSNAMDGIQELTTVESTYQPTFPDDDDEDDKPIKDEIEVSVTEKEISTPRADAKNHDDLKINNTIEIEKKSLENKASGKEDQAGIEEEKAQINDTKETGQLKHDLPLKKDKNNDDAVINAVTVNIEKNGSNKEYISSKRDNNGNGRPSEDNVRPRDEDYKNDRNKNINVTTDTNSEKGNKPKERSRDTKKGTSVSVERFMGTILKSGLTNNHKNNSYDYKEQHSIYSHKDSNENSNKQFKNRSEKRDEYDRKKKDKNDNRKWSKKRNAWNKIDKNRYNKDNGHDRMEYEWNKRHQQYDDNENINDSQWNKNDDSNSRHRDWKKRDNDWNERDIGWNRRDNDGNNRDIDSNKRDRDWNKRDTEWIKQDSKTFKDDRNKNEVRRKQSEWENKYLRTSVESDNDNGKEHTQYEIIERKIKDGD